MKFGRARLWIAQNRTASIAWQTHAAPGGPAMRGSADSGQFSVGRPQARIYATRLLQTVAGATMTSINDRTPSVQSGAAAGTWRTPALIVGFGCLIALMSFGPRSSLGFFLTPLSNANHWGRDVFAFALALQNLLWGVGQPIAGMIADRFGTARVICAGCLHVRLRAGAHGARRQRAAARCLGRRADRFRTFRHARSWCCSRHSASCCRGSGVRSPSALAPRPARSGNSCIRRVAVALMDQVRLATDADDFRRQLCCLCCRCHRR